MDESLLEEPPVRGEQLAEHRCDADDERQNDASHADHERLRVPAAGRVLEVEEEKPAHEGGAHAEQRDRDGRERRPRPVHRVRPQDHRHPPPQVLRQRREEARLARLGVRLDGDVLEGEAQAPAVDDRLQRVGEPVVDEQAQRRGAADGAEAAGGVGDARARHAPDEARPPSLKRAFDGRKVCDPIGLAVTDDDVRPTGQDGRDDTRDVLAAVLVVGIGVDDHVGAQAERGVDAGGERRGEPAVVGKAHDVVHSELHRPFARSVGAPVVDDEDLDLVDPVHHARQIRHGLREVIALVIAGNLDDELHDAAGEPRIVTTRSPTAILSSAMLTSPGARTPPMPAAFVRDHERSHGDPRADNAIVVGDNLPVMRRLLASGFGARFRCIYFDPPYNSGRRFAEYEDALDPAAWRAMMRERLEAARDLLAPDGAIFVEIDDTELGPLQVEMDGVFGREQRVSTVTVVRSAATGHKAINRGPVNVTDFLLVYGKDRAAWRAHPIMRERARYDSAYSTWLENPADLCEAWRFVPLAAHVRATRAGRTPTRSEVEQHAVEHAEHVVRFAQPRYEAVSRAARAAIDRSRREPGKVLRLARAGRKDLVLRAGNRVLFLADKVAVREGRRVLVEPLTNLWDDIGFQGIAKEGGARFVRNKKPEKLLARILALSTAPGDWVLDAFLGSGTTAAVAHKMGRRWVGIEQGPHVDALCIPRLRRVVDGRDPSGVTRALGWEGGGGFHVWT